jgi:hypothetical protein
MLILNTSRFEHLCLFEHPNSIRHPRPFEALVLVQEIALAKRTLIENAVSNLGDV